MRACTEARWACAHRALLPLARAAGGLPPCMSRTHNGPACGCSAPTPTPPAGDVKALPQPSLPLLLRAYSTCGWTTRRATWALAPPPPSRRRVGPRVGLGGASTRGVSSRQGRRGQGPAACLLAPPPAKRVRRPSQLPATAAALRRRLTPLPAPPRPAGHGPAAHRQVAQPHPGDRQEHPGGARGGSPACTHTHTHTQARTRTHTHTHTHARTPTHVHHASSECPGCWQQRTCGTAAGWPGKPVWVRVPPFSPLAWPFCLPITSSLIRL